jgi:hypothetical protein
MRISLPVSMGGMGLRLVQRIMDAAYFASALEALPDLLRLRPQLRTAGDTDAANARNSPTFLELAELQERIRAVGVGARRQSQSQLPQSLQHSFDFSLLCKLEYVRRVTVLTIQTRRRSSFDWSS